KGIVARSRIQEGAELEVSYSRGKVILQPVKVPSLKELLAQLDPANRPELADWGGPVGREVW
ncbi:MAG TPA: hypothetical protein VN541_11745, partial [Tepidisphaeraceae bacterium]|nr:hypothetical protein [Tepidisphaeraceae bacterium]